MIVTLTIMDIHHRQAKLEELPQLHHDHHVPALVITTIPLAVHLRGDLLTVIHIMHVIIITVKIPILIIGITRVHTDVRPQLVIGILGESPHQTTRM